MADELINVTLALLILAGALTQSILLLGLAIIILLVLPPSYDPAIRFKEWTMRKGKK